MTTTATAMFTPETTTTEEPRDKLDLTEGLGEAIGTFAAILGGGIVFLLLMIAAFIVSHHAYVKYVKKPLVEKKSLSIWFVEQEKKEEKERPLYSAQINEDDSSSISSQSTNGSEGGPEKPANASKIASDKDVKLDMVKSYLEGSGSKNSSFEEKHSAYTNPSFRNAMENGVDFVAM